MLDLLWLLLPLAAASGWYAARRTYRRGHHHTANRSGDTLACSSEYIRGLNYLLNDQTDEALEVFLEALEIDPETVETHLVLGNLFRRRGEVDRATRIHQNLLARPNLSAQQRSQVLLELGKDYLRAGVLDRAETLFQELTQERYPPLEAFDLLRGLYEQEKEWDKAIEASRALQNAGGGEQGSVIAHYYCELAEQALGQGDTQQALAEIKRAQQSDRHCVRASVLSGDLDLKMGEAKRAIKKYQQILRQDQAFTTLALERLYRSFQAQDDMAGFDRLLQKLSTENLSPALTESLFDYYSSHGEPERLDWRFSSLLDKHRMTLSVLKSYLHAKLIGERTRDTVVNERVMEALDELSNREFAYRCERCGYEAHTLSWQCPSCHGWGTIKPSEWLDVTAPSVSGILNTQE
ncbi:MAG: lipopolysaccharide assembly protein LapB [Gammaproteobacteria bacterium]|jgi:lipopolysaccharide biosynthesis regulator YciM